MSPKDGEVLRAAGWSIFVASLAVAIGATFTWGLQEPPPEWFQPFLSQMANWVVAAFTGLLAYITYRLVQSTNKLWATDERRFALEQRPWLQVVVDPKATFMDAESGAGPTAAIRVVGIGIVVQNVGKTPAFHVVPTVALCTGDRTEEVKRHQSDVPSLAGDTMFPGKSLRFSFDPSISRKEIEEFESPHIAGLFGRMAVVVNVHYRDGTGRTCQTALVYSFFVSTSRAPNGAASTVALDRVNAETVAT